MDCVVDKPCVDGDRFRRDVVDVLVEQARCSGTEEEMRPALAPPRSGNPSEGEAKRPTLVLVPGQKQAEKWESSNVTGANSAGREA
jgi:hypothetical protein